MSLPSQKLESFLKETLEIEDIHVSPLIDENHLLIYAKSALFKGKTRLQQHKIIYEALEKLSPFDKPHAVQIKTEYDG